MQAQREGGEPVPYKALLLTKVLTETTTADLCRSTLVLEELAAN